MERGLLGWHHVDTHNTARSPITSFAPASEPVARFQFAAPEFSGDALRWRRRGGGALVTIVIKATYRLEPDECPLVGAGPEPIHAQDIHVDLDPQNDVYRPADLVPVKPCPEVLVVARRPADDGGPARIQIGTVNKSLPRGGTGAGAGPDSVGVRQTYPFGPLALSSPGRRARALGSKPPLCELLGKVPLPHGFDESYFQAAPSDQWLAELASDQVIVLDHLVPNRARLVTRLPGVEPRVSLWQEDDTAVVEQLVADTLWVDASRGLCTLTWRAVVTPPSVDEPLLVHVDRALPTCTPRDAPAVGRQPGARTTYIGVRSDLGETEPWDLREAFASTLPPAPLPDIDPRFPSAPVVVDQRPTQSSESPAEVPAPTDLVWFEPSWVPLIRRVPAFRALVAREPVSLSAVRKTRGDLLLPPAPSFAADAVDVEQEDLEAVLAHSEPCDLSELKQVLRRDSTQWLSVVEGQLELIFDEGDRLALTVACATPAARTSAPLRALIESIDALNSAPLAGSPSVQRSITERIRAAWSHADDLLPASFLEENVERLLLERRLHQRRRLFGGDCIVGRISDQGAREGVPVYLPADAGPQLPLIASTRMRLIVRVHPRQDAAEPHAVALEALAVARCIAD